MKRGQIKTIRRKDVRKRVLFSLAVLGSIALVLGFLFFTAGSSRAASAGSFAPTPIPSVPVPVETEPALPPSAGVPAVIHAGGGPPTNADIRAFVAKYGFSGGKMAKGGVPTILAVTLMPAKQAKALLKGESTDRPDTAMVYYVQLAGPFVLTMPTPPGVKPITVQKGEELFDATTGNLILYGSSG